MIPVQACPACPRYLIMLDRTLAVLHELAESCGHRSACQFAACTCGALDDQKIALGEAARVLRDIQRGLA